MSVAYSSLKKSNSYVIELISKRLHFNISQLKHCHEYAVYVHVKYIVLNILVGLYVRMAWITESSFLPVMIKIAGNLGRGITEKIDCSYN